MEDEPGVQAYLHAKIPSIDVLPGLLLSLGIILAVLLCVMVLPLCYVCARIFYPRPISNECFCLAPKTQRLVLILAFLTCVLLSLLELGFHLTLLHTSTGVHQTARHNIKETYGEAVRNAEAHLNPDDPDPGKWWQPEYGSIDKIDRLFQQYRTYLLKILSVGQTIQRFDLEPEYMMLKHKILINTWFRYLFFHLLWIQPMSCYLLRIACHSGTSTACAVAGVLFCWGAGALVMAEAMALDDYCKQPDQAITYLGPEEQLRFETFYCPRLADQCRNLVTQYLTLYHVSRERAKHDISEETALSYPDNLETTQYLHTFDWREIKSRYCKTWAEVFNVPAKRNQYDMPNVWVYNLTCANYSLNILETERCTSQLLLVWLVLQLVALFFLVFLSIGMLIMAITRTTARKQAGYIERMNRAKKVKKRKAKEKAARERKEKREGKGKVKSEGSSIKFICRKKKRQPGRRTKSRLISLPDDEGNLTSAMLVDVDKETKILMPLQQPAAETSSSSSMWCSKCLKK